MPALAARRFRPAPTGSVLATAATVLFCSCVAIGCSSSAGSPAPEQVSLATLEAELLTIQPQRWPVIVRSQGSLMADEVTVIGAKVPGQVAEVHVDLGDVVEAGTALVTLARDDYRLEVERAEAQLAQARSAVGLNPGDAVEQLEPKNAPPARQELAIWNETKARLARAQGLRGENAFALEELEQIVAAEQVAAARYTSALNSVREKIALIGVRQAELSMARRRLQDATVHAPFAGLVQQRNVAPGAYLQVGHSIATLVRTNPLRFRGTVPERHAQSLSAGQQVELRIESVDQPKTGSVTRVSPTLDHLTRALLFEAEIDNSDGQLRAGLFAEAEVVVDPRSEALVVPQSSVVEFAGAEKVWKVTDGVAVEQEVLTGERRPRGIRILRGLAVGDVILRQGNQGRAARIIPIERASEDGALNPMSTGKSSEAARP